MPSPIVLIPGFMGSQLKRVRDHQTIWVDPLWAFFHQSECFDGLTLTTPDDPELYASHVLEEVDVDNLVRQGIYRELREFALASKPEGLGLSPQQYREFPFDWRKSVARAAHDLDALLLAGDPDEKVTLIAHSQGGLVVQRLFALGGAGAQRVGKIIAVGCPFGGLVKTVELLEEGVEVPLLPSASIRQALLRMPGAYELMPHRPTEKMFLDEAGNATTPFEQAAALDVHLYDQRLLRAAGEMVNGLAHHFPVPLRLVKGIGLTTALRAQIRGDRIQIDKGPEGDGTCPNVSLESAVGTSVNGEPATGTLTLPGGEHVELVRDRRFFDFLKVELGRTGAAAAAA